MSVLLLIAMLAIPDTVENREIKRRAYEDLYYFARVMLGYNLLTPKLHGPICREIQNCKGDLYVKIPRDHLKTTCAIAFCIHSIVNDPDIKILYSHKILLKAKGVLDEIKGHFEKNEMFRGFFGDWVGEPWGTQGITVSKRKVGRKEPTISIGGVDHESTGGHYNILVNDDLAGLGDMYSLAEREASIRYYRSLRYLRDAGSCRELNLGTAWAIGDVHDWAKAHRKDMTWIERRAIENGVPIFPERYTVADLEQLRAEDTVLYESQMNNSPLSEVNQLFPLDKLLTFQSAMVNGAGNTMAYVDPAFGKRARGEPCYFSMPIGRVNDGKIYVMDWVLNQDKPEQNEQAILAKIKQHGITSLVIESNAAQSEFARNVKGKIAEQHLICSVKEYNNSANKDRRIQSAQGTILRSVLFRDDWKTAYPQAIEQITLYPQHKFVDAPDSLEGLIANASLRSGIAMSQTKAEPARMAGIRERTF